MVTRQTGSVVFTNHYRRKIRRWYDYNLECERAPVNVINIAEHLSPIKHLPVKIWIFYFSPEMSTEQVSIHESQFAISVLGKPQ